jgi:ribosomal protein L1
MPKNEFLTKAWLQIQNIFQIFNLNSYTNSRKFTETVELQIGLKNYDPQKTSVSVALLSCPTSPDPRWRCACLVMASTLRR